MSNTNPFLKPGEIRRLHHTAVPYYALGVNDRTQEPLPFERLRKFWENLGMRCDALFAEESPDRGEPGWRLYVGSVRDPVQIVYRPVLSHIAWQLSMICTYTTHICLDVGPDTLQKLREHPARERVAKWGPNHGLSSVLIKGPMDEEIEFTYSSPVTDD